MNTWRKDDLCTIKKNIFTLINAADQSLSHLNTSKNIPEIFDTFVVRTAKTKTWKEKCKMPPKSSELVLVKDLQFWFTVRIAREKISCNFEDKPTLPQIIESDHDEFAGFGEDYNNSIVVQHT